MKQSRRKFVAGMLVTSGSLPFVVAAQADLAGTAKQQTNREAAATVVLRGYVVCYTEEFARRHDLKPECESNRPLWGMLTTDDQLYSFLPTDTAAAIYEDIRFRLRQLQVTARHFPGSTWLEIIKLQSVRDGRVYDLFYYCDVCNIRTHKPGPCVCCQDPVVFHEDLADIAPSDSQF